MCDVYLKNIYVLFLYFNLKFNIYKMLILNTFVLIVHSLFLHLTILYIILYICYKISLSFMCSFMFIFLFFSSLIYTKSSINFKLLI